MTQTVKQFSRIFISHRRDAHTGHALLLFHRLEAHFGENQIFIDIEKMKLGQDFVRTLDEALNSCDVLIALIDQNWHTICDEHGQRRLDDPQDYVRREIAAALTRGIGVIPVLLPGAHMPRPEELPDELSPLSHRNALELSIRSWHLKHDLEQLISSVEGMLAETSNVPAAPPKRGERTITVAVVFLMLVAIITAGVIWYGATKKGGVHYRVPGNTAWKDVGLVTSQEHLIIDVKGSISLGDENFSPPAGLSDLFDAKKPMPSEPTGALIARIDDEQPFVVGAGKDFYASRNGHLFLGINEGNLDDNTGSYDARIQKVPPSPFGLSPAPSP
jgi:hypothetical protein